MNTDLMAQKCLDRIAKEGPESLTERERTLAAVWLFAAGVGNGGFAGYFSSHRADLAAEAPAALRAIGARQLARLAAEANAVFGAHGPPADHAARRDRLHALPEDTRARLGELDRRYFDCEEDVDALLERFLQADAEPA